MKSTLVNRRTLMAGSAAAGLASTVGLGQASAAAPMLGVSMPSHYRFKLGAFEVTTIRDGAVQVPGPHPIFGENAAAEDVAALAAANFLPTDKMEIGFTVTVVNTGSEVILFDTGNGDTGRRPNAGLLLERLAASGIAPADVDVVALTHYHGDHIGGMTEGGAPAFPNARYVTGAEEYNYWSNGDLLLDNAMAGRAQMVQDKVAIFAEAMSFIAPGDAVVSGVEAVKAWGHTPGHTAYHIESEGQRLMLIGDACNHHVVSLQRPDWHVRFDMDKEAAVASRKALLGMIAADRIPFVGYHMPGSAVGYLEAKGDGFGYVPASYQLNL
jgi:glyoxylase-like metal-dependent hydrolase (beta-lactamase superfamily II)